MQASSRPEWRLALGADAPFDSPETDPGQAKDVPFQVVLLLLFLLKSNVILIQVLALDTIV